MLVVCVEFIWILLKKSVDGVMMPMRRFSQVDILQCVQVTSNILPRVRR